MQKKDNYSAEDKRNLVDDKRLQKKQKLVSIIIPAYNEEEYIEKTLFSILNQDYTNIQTIIACNGCTDNTIKKIQKIKTKHTKKKKINNEKIQILNIKTANVSLARNLAANKAKAKLLIFLDADTILRQDAITKITQKFLSSTSVASTFNTDAYNGYKKNKKTHKFLFHLISKYKNFLHKHKIYKGIYGVFICKKEDFVKVGGFNQKLKVLEFKDLINKLLTIGNYQFLDQVKSSTSMRRYQKLGFKKVLLFWTKKSFLFILNKKSKQEYQNVR